MAQGGQGQGDGGVGGAASGDGGVPAGGRVGVAGGQGDGSILGWRGGGLGVMRERLAVTSMRIETDQAQHVSLCALTCAVWQTRVRNDGERGGDDLKSAPTDIHAAGG